MAVACLVVARQPHHDHRTIGYVDIIAFVINPRAEIERKTEFRKTLLKRGATIGANATIICGHSLGSTVLSPPMLPSKEVPAYSLMVGLPPRRAGGMSRAGAKLGRDVVCPIDGFDQPEHVEEG
jgi:hypothetical protein